MPLCWMAASRILPTACQNKQMISSCCVYRVDPPHDEQHVSLKHVEAFFSQADHQQTRKPNTHRRHTHAATYCVIIQTQRTQISGRNSNGTKHSGGPPEDGREKIPKHVGVLYLQTRF
jgi:hypothetical protein